VLALRCDTIENPILIDASFPGDPKRRGFFACIGFECPAIFDSSRPTFKLVAGGRADLLRQTGVSQRGTKSLRERWRAIHARKLAAVAKGWMKPAYNISQSL
jgi:hypothetical protein